MKKFIFASVLLICFSAVNFAQSHDVYEEAPMKRNSVYLELGGNSMLYSINYDHTMQLSQKVKLAVGGGLEYLTDISVNNTSYGTSFCLTPSANFLFGRSSHHFETGLGLFYPLSAGIILPSARLGYRYQPRHSGFLFRAGFTPFITSGGILPWAGLSFGYTF